MCVGVGVGVGVCVCLGEIGPELSSIQGDIAVADVFNVDLPSLESVPQFPTQFLLLKKKSS